MGIIASIAPGLKVSHHIPRENVTNKDIFAAGQILIKFHKKDGISVAKYHQLPLMTAQDLIDMNPSDTTCIYSTLSFISENAKCHGVTPVITFDQPLWWKASMILQGEPDDSDLHKTVLRLGGLHVQMSFLGAIGHLMAGSGLHEVLDLIYASKAVDHILSGKTIARAVRAHLLVDAALNTLLTSH